MADTSAAADRNTLKKQDRNFLQHLATREAVRHLSDLRRIAARKFPSEQASRLGIEIDFTRYPPHYDVFRLDTYETKTKYDSRVVGKAIENQGRYTLVQTIINSGRNNTLSLVLSAGSIWETGDNALAIVPWTPSRDDGDELQSVEAQVSSEVD